MDDVRVKLDSVHMIIINNHCNLVRQLMSDSLHDDYRKTNPLTDADAVIDYVADNAERIVNGLPYNSNSPVPLGGLTKDGVMACIMQVRFHINIALTLLSTKCSDGLDIAKTLDVTFRIHQLSRLFTVTHTAIMERV